MYNRASATSAKHAIDFCLRQHNRQAQTTCCHSLHSCTTLSYHHICNVVANRYAFQLILVWTPGKGSPIHDHANAHCVMKILKGSLKETIYGWPCQNAENPTHCATASTSCYPSTEHTCSRRGAEGPSELQIKRETTYTREGVTYMSDRLGLHRICNPSDSELAVSLHLYTVSSINESMAQLCALADIRSHQTQRNTAATSSTSRLVRRHTSLNATSTLSLA